MPTCGSCNAEVPQAFRFCGNCGAPVAETTVPREIRKTVTIVFSDLSGSTAMGERLDPEALRGVMSDYFDRMKADVEHHGGTVEKFIGDAVMAVFGVPATHEDDALRAVRAAVAMRRSLQEINGRLERAHGLTLAMRTGVNTGEVIAGQGADRQRLVTGDAVNVAARLEQAAPTDEILLGRETYRLVRDAVEVEELDPLELKGKTDPVPAYRLIELRDAPSGVARRSDTVFVGRQRELGLLSDAFSRTVEDRTCHLFTVLGSAGVGKSRLVAEALERIEPAPRVISGRCLPYGDGITFWPVLEMIRDACGLDEAAPSSVVGSNIAPLLRDIPDADVVGRRLTDLFGLSTSAGVTLEETFWAVRRFMETLAAQTPVVVEFDDLHWAEPALLELIEHLSDWSRVAPILVLCLARPEFLDDRPGWSGGKMNATTILLEPLDRTDSRTLVQHLMMGGELPPPFVTRVAEIAEGNPLFVEELLAMLVDEEALARDDDRWIEVKPLDEIELPSSIQVLLASRLERLAPPEIAVLEGAAVVGQVFYRDAVSALAPESLRPDVGTYLRSLMRKDFVRPEPGGREGEESYRFRHILIRDAAYQAMSKRTRADLHERFATWLESLAAERITEVQEIVGYHLEQVVRYRTELGLEADGSVSRRAAEHLTQAAWRAAAREDQAAMFTLLRRAVDLEPDLIRRGHLQLDLVSELMLDERPQDAQRELHTLFGDLEQSADEVLRWRAILLRDNVRSYIDPHSITSEEGDRNAAAAIAALERLGDHRTLSDAWYFRGLGEWAPARFDRASEHLEQALRYAAMAGDQRRATRTIYALVSVLAKDSTPRGTFVNRSRELLSRLDPGVATELIGLYIDFEDASLAGNGDLARRITHQAREMAEQMGRPPVARDSALTRLVAVERREARPAAVEAAARPLFDNLTSAGNVSEGSTVAGYLAEALTELGRHDEAEEFATIARDTASDDDVASQSTACRAFARIAAHRGDAERALALARDGVATCEEAEWPEEQGMARFALSEVAAQVGALDEAKEAAEAALRCFETKGIEPLIRRARQQLDTLTT